MKKIITIVLVAFALSLLNINCSNQKKQLTIWIGGSVDEVNFWQSLINDYEKQTGTKIILVRQPTSTDQRRQSLVIPLESKLPDPDLFLMDIVWINQFIKSGWLQPLDNYINKSSFSLKPFFPNIMKQVDIYKNTTYAIPVFMDVGLLYYRKDLLEQNGYDSPPKEWKQLVEESEKIQNEQRKTNKNFSGFVWQGAQYEGLICDYLEFTTSFGGYLMQGDSITINNQKNLKGLQFMRDLIQKYKISPPNTYTEMKEEEVRRLFQNGGALFERNWSYAWALHQSEDSKVKGKIGVTVLPHYDNDSSTSALGGWHIGLSKYSDMKNEAWKFIQYVTSYKVQEKMFEQIGWNPAREDVYKDSTLLSKYPRLKTLKEALKISKARPTIPYYPQVSQIIQRYVNNCLAGKISPQDALNKAQSEIDELMKIYEK
jgi:multiple sugar transport system substrate-binding protein